MGNVSRVIVSKTPVAERTVVALTNQEHILARDVPKVGKPLLAKCLAAYVGRTVKRIQCTRAFLTSDIAEISIYNQRTSQF